MPTSNANEREDTDEILQGGNNTFYGTVGWMNVGAPKLVHYSPINEAGRYILGDTTLGIDRSSAISY